MFFLAWRQLMAKKKQTLLILLGISFGTLLFVSISGVQLGMREYIVNQLLNNTAHILISGAEHEILAKEVTEALYPKENVLWVSSPAGKRDEAKLQNYQGWVQRLESDSRVFDYSPRLSSNAILTLGKFSASVGIIGTIPDRHIRLSKVDLYIKEGNFNTLKSGGSNIVIGSGVANNLGAKLNQVLQVSAGKGETVPYKIVGIVHYGNKQFDESVAFTNLENAQTLTKNPGRITAIAVSLNHTEESKTVAEEWASISKDKVEDWQTANKAFMEVIKMQDFTRYFITSAILIVAAFGIYNVLTIMINQKRKEIAILRAIGYGPKKILELILYQGIVLGLAGGIVGIVLGFLLCLWIGSIDFGFEIGGSNHLLMSYNWDIYVTAFITANVASIIASFIPAWEASRMTPMDIIRSE